MDSIVCFIYSLKTSEWISIIQIIVTSSIGIWIGVTFQKQQATNKAVKDYLISECNKINEKYCNFFNSLYQGQLSSEYIKEWFKVMTINIDIYNSFLIHELKIQPEILPVHNKLKQFITFTDEFNESYKLKQMKLRPTSQKTVLELHNDYKFAVTKIIIDITKAKKNKKLTIHKTASGA